MDSSSTAWRYFEVVAENYSQVAHFRLWSAIKILERRGLMELVPDFAGKSIRVLELGAGTGYYSGELLKMAQSHLCAVDFSPKMLERHPYACEKIVADIEALPDTLRA